MQSDHRVTHVWTASVQWAVVLGTTCVVGISTLFSAVEFSVFRSDVKHYIDWSHGLFEFGGFESHMPGFSALIALMRILTFGLFSDVTVARIVAYIAWLSSIFIIREILKISSPKFTNFGIALFSFFPFVTQSYIAYPLTETTARCVFLAAFLSMLQKRWFTFTLFVSLGLLIHQAFWPCYLFLTFVCVFQYRMKWICAIGSVLPLAAYYVYMAIVLNSWNWIYSGHSRMHLSSGGHVVLFEGIAQSFVLGDVIGVLKSTAVTTILIVSLYLVFKLWVKKEWSYVAFLVSIVFFAPIASEKIMFLVVRLSPLLVVPFFRAFRENEVLCQVSSSRIVTVLMSIGLAGTQFAWAYYIWRFFPS